MNTDTLQPIVTLIKDIVTGLAALTGAFVAVQGLRAWKEQLKGKTEYELARRILVAVYKVKDALTRAYVSLLKVDDVSPEIVREFQDRAFSELENAEIGLRVELLEAQAIWGDEPLFQFSVVRLKGFSMDLDFVRSGYRPVTTEGLEEKQQDSHSYLDNFSEKVNKAVKEIEDLLRPKLNLTHVKHRKQFFHWRRRQK